MVHDTGNPLSCCPRCHEAELGWRAGRHPAFRYDRAEPAEAPLYYRVFHGDQPVATVSLAQQTRSEPYEVTILGDGERRDLLGAATLREARRLAGTRYTALWRDGRYAARGPVQPAEM